MKKEKNRTLQQKVWYRPNESAEYLCISIATFWNYVKQNKISTKKLTPRVTVVNITELENFINCEVA